MGNSENFNEKDNLYTKDYPDYNPIFKNRLDKLKFLNQKFNLDYSVAKTKNKNVVVDFLNSSITFIDNEIDEVEIHLLTNKYHKTYRKLFIEACRELNFLKNTFNDDLINLGEEPSKIGFEIYKNTLDENIKYISNSDEIEKEFRKGINDFPIRSTNEYDEIFTGKDNKGYLLFYELYFNGKIEKGNHGFKDYIGYVYRKMFLDGKIIAKVGAFCRFLEKDPFDLEIQKLKAIPIDKLTSDKHKHYEDYSKMFDKVYKFQK